MEAADDSWAVLSIEQLFGVGMTRGDIRSACRRGSLMALGGGLYLRGCRHAGEEGWRQDVAIACARRPDAAVCGETAAALRSLDGFAPGAPITLWTEPSGSPGRGVRRITRLGPVAQISGLPATDIDETLLDLGASLTPRPGCHGATRPLDPVELVELAVEDALRRGLTTVDRLREVVAAANRSRPGRRVLAAVLADRPAGAAPTESYLETRCLQVLRHGGLGDFERQVVLEDHDGVIGRVDLCRNRVVLELVGARWHLDRFDADHRRYARISAAGYRLLPFTFSDVEHRPDHVTRSTAAALAGVESRP